MAKAMPPFWLTVLAWVFLATAFACALEIGYDIFGRGYRQRMGVMEVVWPVTALSFGPAASWVYRRYGRPQSSRWQREHGDAPDKPAWATTAVGVSHCGAGCTLGDIAAEFAVFGIGATLLGLALIPEYIGDNLLAIILGVGFQYFAIAPMRGLGLRDGLVAAAKADFLSLTSFEIGLFGWMAIMHLVLFPRPHLRASSPSYSLLMQVGMIVGFTTAGPTNVWLIRRGIKEAM